MKKTITGAAAAVAILAATGAQGGCGSSSAPKSSSGGAGSPLVCNFDTQLGAPIHHQLTATSSVTCNFPVGTAKTTLVIQGRKTGSGETAWDNFDDPKTSGQVPPNSLTYTVTCIGGYDYQASADITGLADNGAPFHADETSPVVAYTAAECKNS